jgi:hypothetical protein
MAAWRLKTVADLPNTPGGSKNGDLHFELKEGFVCWRGGQPGLFNPNA